MGKSLVSHGVDVSEVFADVFLLQTDPMNLQLCLTCNRHIRHSFCDDDDPPVFLAVLDPRVGHTMGVLSPFISVLCHSD